MKIAIFYKKKFRCKVPRYIFSFLVIKTLEPDKDPHPDTPWLNMLDRIRAETKYKNPTWYLATTARSSSAVLPW